MHCTSPADYILGFECYVSINSKINNQYCIADLMTSLYSVNWKYMVRQLHRFEWIERTMYILIVASKQLQQRR
jgi:hypothetical protein